MLLFLTNSKLYLTYGMVLCLVTLTDLLTRRADLSASAELLVGTACVRFVFVFDTRLFLKRLFLRYSTSKKCRDLEIGVRGHSSH